MKKEAVSAALFGFALCGFLPASAQAEIAIAESMEWVLANSDRVIVGQVVKVDKVTGPDIKEYEAATVAISKTLKGAQADRETFLIQYYNGKYAQEWMDEKTPILFCLVKNDGKRTPFPVAKFQWVLRDDGHYNDAVLLGKSKQTWTGSTPVLASHCEVLTEKKAILKFVEQTLKAAVQGRAPRSHTLDVPSETAVFKELWSGSVVELIVPIDENLEELGRYWCKSASYNKRTEGAKVLRYFKNEKNIEILKSLLGDPITVIVSQEEPGKDGRMELVYRKNLYFVRQAAFDALHELGVNVPRPVLEELLEGRDAPALKKDH